MNTPSPIIQQQLFRMFITEAQSHSMVEDLIIAHKVIKSGTANRWKCRIPINTRWNTDIMSHMLHEYHDQLDLIEWLKFGFPISRDYLAADPIPATTNHLGATLFPNTIDEYIEKEIRLKSHHRPLQNSTFHQSHRHLTHVYETEERFSVSKSNSRSQFSGQKLG